MTDAEVRDKLYIYADTFKSCVSNKNWFKAKYIYESARDIAVFMELDRETMIELFGDRPDRETIVKGAFEERLVQKVFLECMKVKKE